MKTMGYLFAIPALALSVGCTDMTPTQQSTLSGAAMGAAGGPVIGGVARGGARGGGWPRAHPPG